MQYHSQIAIDKQLVSVSDFIIAISKPLNLPLSVPGSTTSISSRVPPITCGEAIPVAALLHALGVEVLADDMQVQRLQRRNAVIATP